MVRLRSSFSLIDESRLAIMTLPVEAALLRIAISGNGILLGFLARGIRLVSVGFSSSGALGWTDSIEPLSVVLGTKGLVGEVATFSTLPRSLVLESWKIFDDYIFENLNDE